MSKIYFLIVLFLALGCGYFFFRKSMLENDLERLETNYNAIKGSKIFLEKEIEERNKEKILLSQRNRELEEEAKKDKSSFDWDYNISNSPVIKWLQAN